MSKKIANQKSKNISSKVVGDDLPIREEILKWVFTIFSSFIVFSIIAYIIADVFQPDIKKLLAESNELSFLGLNRPEPVEGLLVRSGILLLPILLFIFYHIFSGRGLIKKINSNGTFTGVSVVLIVFLLVLIYKDFSALNPFNPGTGEQAQHNRDLDGKTNYEFYFKGLFLGNNFFLYCFFLLPIIFGIFIFGIKKNNWDSNLLFNKIISFTSYLFIGIILLCIISMNIFKFPYTYENKYDLNAVYYSMTQVYVGTPMLIDNFTNTYGLYPHFLNPVFQIIGLSVLNFSIIMSIILGASFVFIFSLLRRYISNPLILFLGFITMINFSYLNFRFTTSFDCSFAFFPIRFIIPSTLLFLCSLYLRNKSKIIYWFTTFLMAAFILWNPEIGTVSFLSWVVINLYLDFFRSDNKINYLGMLRHIISAFIVLIITFSLYSLIIYFVYGNFPDLKLLFIYILVFGKYGFGALPMHIIHPWNLIAIVYAIGLLYSLTKLYKRKISNKSTIILLTTLTGIGFFIYFQGRSHNFTFATSSCFGLVLLTLLGDELWTLAKSRNLLMLNLLFFVFLFLNSYSIFDILANSDKLKEMIIQKKDKSKNITEEIKIKTNETFILNNTNPKEKIHVLTSRENDGLYFDGNKRVSAYNPGILEISFNSDLHRLENMFLNSTSKVFLEQDKFNLYFMRKSVATLAARYKCYKSAEAICMLIPGKNNIPENVFFNPDSLSIIHEKYTNDSSGIKRRIENTDGTKVVDLESDFSIQLLFQPDSQVYRFATLIGNMTDTAGFAFAHNLGMNKFYFCINGNCYDINVPDSRWVYLAANVYNNKIEIYQNGNLSNSFPLVQPYRNSDKKVFIGNLGNMRYYFGGIAEVSLSKRITNANDAKETWTKIQSSLK